MRFLPIGTLTIALAATSAAAAQDSDPAPASGASGPIVVTAIRIQDYRARLAACLARNCPVNEDVDASLALAEALFLNGDYVEARQAVRASIGRNRRLASRFPEPVSDLHRAYSRVSRHLGYDDQAARSTDEILRALQAGLPQEDYRHFTARLEIADLQMGMSNATRARRELAELIRIARAAGREDVAVMAELRTIWFDYLVDRYGDATARLAAMANVVDPARNLQATGAKVLLARIYRAEGQIARADALLAEIGRGTSQQRRLISSPPYELLAQERTNALEMVTNSGGSASAVQSIVALGNNINRIPDNFRDKWIDVGFWVMPDGHVSGLEIVRQSSEDPWADPLIASIQGRLYSTAAEPTYRLERYTYTSRYETATGTRMQQHSPRARVEYMDLTANAPAASPPS
jgi:tetratricopeptide (TPR) repeat protein